MINNQDLINEINIILKKTYPIENTIFKNTLGPYNLSHFRILNSYDDLYLPFNFDINGKILSGKYKSYQIIKVNNKSWNKYFSLCLSFSNIIDNPCISQKFLFNLHKKSKIDILCITPNKEKNETKNIKSPYLRLYYRINKFIGIYGDFINLFIYPK